MAEADGDGDDWSYCDICHMSFKTKNQSIAHYRSFLHSEKVLTKEVSLIWNFGWRVVGRGFHLNHRWQIIYKNNPFHSQREDEEAKAKEKSNGGSTSKSSKKAAATEEEEEDEGDWSWCDICHMSFKTKNQSIAHYRSFLHSERVLAKEVGRLDIFLA